MACKAPVQTVHRVGHNVKVKKWTIIMFLSHFLYLVVPDQRLVVIHTQMKRKPEWRRRRLKTEYGHQVFFFLKPSTHALSLLILCLKAHIFNVFAFKHKINSQVLIIVQSCNYTSKSELKGGLPPLQQGWGAKAPLPPPPLFLLHCCSLVMQFFVNIDWTRMFSFWVCKIPYYIRKNYIIPTNINFE